MTPATTIESLRRHAEAIRLAELARQRTTLAALTPDEQQAIDRMTARLVDKLLSEPAVRLTEPFVPFLRELFALEEAA